MHGCCRYAGCISHVLGNLFLTTSSLLLDIPLVISHKCLEFFMVCWGSLTTAALLPEATAQASSLPKSFLDDLRLRLQDHDYIA